MKIKVGSYVGKNFYTDAKRDLTADQLAGIGAVTMAWNGIEGCLDGLFVLGTELAGPIAIDVASRIGGLDGKISVIRKCAESTMLLPPSLCEEFGRCLDEIGLHKTYRNAIIHAHVIDPAAGIGGGLERQGKLYQVLLTKEALDSLYDRMCLSTKELIDMVWLWLLLRAEFAIRRKKSKKIDIGELLSEPGLQVCVSQFLEHRKTAKSLPPLPSLSETPPTPRDWGVTMAQAMSHFLPKK